MTELRACRFEGVCRRNTARRGHHPEAKGASDKALWKTRVNIGLLGGESDYCLTGRCYTACLFSDILLSWS